jgi:hypothetical protein
MTQARTQLRRITKEIETLKARVEELETANAAKDVEIERLTANLARSQELARAGPRTETEEPLNPMELPELLARILCFVPFPRVLQLERVCKSWRDLLRTDTMLRWHTFWLAVPPPGFEHLLSAEPEVHPVLRRDTCMPKYGLVAASGEYTEEAAEAAFFERKASSDRRYALVVRRIEAELAKNRLATHTWSTRRIYEVMMA